MIDTYQEKSVLIDNDKRVEYIDIFRAIGIILMIMGHVGFGDRFDYFIHAFHMPMFFIISGLFYKNNIETKQFIKKKAKTLLIPYLSFGLFFYLIWTIINWKNKSLSPLVSLFSVNTDGLPIAGALWFLTALFFTEIIYFFVDKIKNKVTKNLMIICIALFGNFAIRILPFRLPFALDAAFVGVGLFHIGFLVNKYRDKGFINKMLNINWIHLICLVIPINIVLIFINQYINMRCGLYGIMFLFWINAVASTIIGINVSKIMEKLFNNKVKRYLCGIGLNSIIYLCFNQIVLLFLMKLGMIFGQMNSLEKIILHISVFLASMIILWIISIIIKKTKLKIFIGRF